MILQRKAGTEYVYGKADRLNVLVYKAPKETGCHKKSTNLPSHKQCHAGYKLETASQGRLWAASVLVINLHSLPCLEHRVMCKQRDLWVKVFQEFVADIALIHTVEHVSLFVSKCRHLA